METDTSMDRTVVFVMSRCHKYAGGWIPEPESPAALREEGIIKPSYGPRKMHWIDAPCSHVRGPHAWKITHLHLDGAEFDRTVHVDRCQTCARYFAEA